MEDIQIVQLYWNRSEQAIQETQVKYGPYCLRIASNIVPTREDAQECVNDTWLAAWNAMPPQRPGVLSTFLGKLTRQISIDRWRRIHASKRGGDTVTLAIEELAGCIPGGEDPEKVVLARELTAAINGFLDTLDPQQRRVFLRRYYYLDGIAAIAQKQGISESKAKSMLHRTRKKLRTYLKKEGLQ